MNTSTETTLTSLHPSTSLPGHQISSSVNETTIKQPAMPLSGPHPTQQQIVVTPSSPNTFQQIPINSIPYSSQSDIQRPASTPINNSQASFVPQPATCQPSSHISSFQSQTFDSKSSLHSTSVIPAASDSSFLGPNPLSQSSSQDLVPEYQCTVQTSSKLFCPTPAPAIVLDQTSLTPPTTNTEYTNTHTPQHKTSVIQTMLKNTSGLADVGLDEMAVSLSFPEVS